MELAGVSLTETDGQIFLRYQPAEGRPAVEAAMVLALLDQSGYGSCKVDAEAVAQAARDCSTSQTPFVVQLAQRLDAAVQVHIAADDMLADLSLAAPEGGQPARVEDILQALAEAGVVFGVDHAAVSQACAAGQVDHSRVARGVAPQHGKDTAFEALLPQTVDRTPQVDSNGLIDYRERGGITVVKAGEALMRRIPPTPGVAGHTVRGRELPQRAGVDTHFATHLPGAEVAVEDSNLLRAAVTGQPVMVERGVTVEPLLRVKEVNLATGNIHFDGSVQVDGEVLQGMKVEASGDIVVSGTVEGGLLEAGGDIRVGCGIIAQSQVRAKGAVSARFAENCSIHAGTVIALDDMALECTLESLNQIIIGGKVPQRGRLVGGSAVAMMLLRVPLLGSTKAGITRVKVGANPELELQLQTLALRLDKEKTTEDNLQKLIKQLTATGDPKGMLERVKASWRQAVQVWSQSLAERAALEQQLALTAKARVDVGLGVDGAVDLAFGGKTAHLRTEVGQGVFSCAPETGIVHTDPSGRVTAIT
ncbi:MAG: FapA family protein [Pseudomonadota bacterium]